MINDQYSNPNWKKFMKLKSRINANMNVQQAIIEFKNALATHRNYIIENTMVYKQIKKIIDKGEEGDAVHEILEDTELYRARIATDMLKDSSYGIVVKNNDVTGLSKYESKEPPLSITPGGRANIPGANYLYLGTTEYTACCECRPPLHCLVSLATFRARRNLRIINLGNDFKIGEYIVGSEETAEEKYFTSQLITQLMFLFTEPVSDQEGYHVSQVIADYIRKAGFDGVEYRSFVGDGNNIALFNTDDSYIDFVNSELILVSSQKTFFNRLNTCQPIGHGKLNELQDCEQRKKDVIDFLKRRDGIIN